MTGIVWFNLIYKAKTIKDKDNDNINNTMYRQRGQQQNSFRLLLVRFHHQPTDELLKIENIRVSAPFPTHPPSVSTDIHAYSHTRPYIRAYTHSRTYIDSHALHHHCHHRYFLSKTSAGASAVVHESGWVSELMDELMSEWVSAWAGVCARACVGEYFSEWLREYMRELPVK